MENKTIQPQIIEPNDADSFECEDDCPNCGECTKQILRSSGHERDSSHDTKTCLKCNKVSFGLDGFSKYY